MGIVIVIFLNILIYYNVSRWWLLASIPIALCHIIFYLVNNSQQRENNNNMLTILTVINLLTILLPFPFWVWLVDLVVSVIVYGNYDGERESGGVNNTESTDIKQKLKQTLISDEMYNTSVSMLQRNTSNRSRARVNNRTTLSGENNSSRRYPQRCDNMYSDNIYNENRNDEKQIGRIITQGVCDGVKDGIKKGVSDYVNKRVDEAGQRMHDYVVSRFKNDEDTYRNNKRRPSNMNDNDEYSSYDRGHYNDNYDRSNVVYNNAHNGSCDNNVYSGEYSSSYDDGDYSNDDDC